MSKLMVFVLLFFGINTIQAQTVVSSLGVTLENCGAVSFRDSRNGKVYGTVKIGGLCWMAEDLRFGECEDTVFSVYRRKSVANRISAGYWGVCMNSVPAGGGYLYNWQGAMNSSEAVYGERTPIGNTSDNNSLKWRGICPQGWVLPSGSLTGSLLSMVNSLYPVTVYDAGGGFRGRFTGFANDTNALLSGRCGYYWSSTNRDIATAYSLHFENGYVNAQSISHKYYGFAVRCVKDESTSGVEVDPGAIEYATMNICPSNRLLKINSLRNATVTGTTVPPVYSWYINNVLIPDSTGATLTYQWELGESYVFKRSATAAGEQAEAISSLVTIPSEFTITTYRGEVNYCPEMAMCKMTIDWLYAKINDCSGNVEYTCSVDGTPLSGTYPGARVYYHFPWNSGSSVVRCTTTFVGDAALAIAPVVDVYDIEIPTLNSLISGDGLQIYAEPTPDGTKCAYWVNGSVSINGCSGYLRHEWFVDGFQQGWEISSHLYMPEVAWGATLPTFVRKTYFNDPLLEEEIPYLEESLSCEAPPRPTEISGGDIYDTQGTAGTDIYIPYDNAYILDGWNRDFVYEWLVDGVVVSSGRYFYLHSTYALGSYTITRIAKWHEIEKSSTCTVRVEPAPSVSAE